VVPGGSDSDEHARGKKRKDAEVMEPVAMAEEAPRRGFLSGSEPQPAPMAGMLRRGTEGEGQGARGS
jgi:hypothetical protein